MRISDWSSDVCSSDLVLDRFVRLDASRTTPGNGLGLALVAPSRDGIAENAPCKGSTTSRRFILSLGLDPLERSQEIGRASCRERVCKYVYNSVVSVT